MSEQNVASGPKAAGRSMTSGKVASLNRTRSSVRLGWLVPTLYILFLMLPLYWLINMSFKTNQEITGAFSLWPRDFTWRNYAVIFSDPSWYSGYINSIIYVVLNTVISLAVALRSACGLRLGCRLSMARLKVP